MSDEQILIVEGLRDLHLPPPIGYWPPAPGWWLVAFLLLIATIGLVLAYGWKLRQLRKPRQLAAEALDNAYISWQSNGNAQEYLQCSHGVLRQLAISQSGRESVARLYGEPWLEWIEQHFTSAVSDAARHALVNGAYQPDYTGSIPQLHTEYARWIKHA